MDDLRIIEGYTLGVFASNTYIAAGKAGDSAVLIDCGQDAAPVVAERLAAHGLTLEAILLDSEKRFSPPETLGHGQNT